jgi:hypothetical protein
MAEIPSHVHADMPVDEPVEIRVCSRRDPDVAKYVLSAWRNEHGTVGSSLTDANGSTPQHLSNLQMKQPYPRKAVAGWQAELIDAVASGLYPILEVR